MRTIDDILAAQTALIDASDGRNLTDDEVTEYEALEGELKDAQRTANVRSRHAAYTGPVGAAVHVASPRQDDGLSRAFDAYLRTGQPNADLAGLRVTNAQGEGAGPAGGYLVPDEFRQKLVDRMVAFGGFASEAETISTSTGAPLEWPTMDDTANVGSITDEHVAVASGADLVFGTASLGAYKYTAAGAGSNLPLRVSVELLQDSAIDIQSLISRKLGERLARAQAPHLVSGTGVGEPLGIVASSLTADRDLDTADAVDYEDLVETTDLLDDAYSGNAKWLMKRNTWSQLRLLVDLSGRPLLQSSIEGISGAPGRVLLGHPVVIDEAMPTLSSAGDTYPIAFGDFREAYLIRRVKSLVVFVNPYSRASNGEVEFHAWERADGTIQNRNAYVILQNNT